MIIPVLMYHSISDDKSNLSISPKEFDNQIKYLKESGYNTIKFNKINDENKHPVIITFDDGYKDNIINALPILKKYNFSSICFIVSDYIGGTNIWDQNHKKYVRKELLNKNDLIEWIKYGMSIGSHSKTHQSLVKLNDNEVNDEIFQSKHDIQSIIGYEVDSFSYPFGNINKLSAAKVKNAYKFAVSTVRSRYNTKKHKKFYIPRIHMSNGLSRLKLFFKIKTMYEDIKYNEKQLYL